MTEDEILASKPYVDPTLDQRAMDLVEASMAAIRALPTVRAAIDALPEQTKAALDNFLCLTAVKALEGKSLVRSTLTNALGEPLEPPLEGEVFQVQPGGSLLLSGQVKP